MRKRIASVGFALEGIATLLRTQVNARIHLVAAIAVVSLAAYVDVQRLEWALLVFAIALVWVAEGLNTGIEFLADAAVPDPHSLIKHAKDVAAGAVLLAPLAAAVIGALVFLPYLPR